MAKLCQKDKIPYLLSTDDRYPWEEPTYQDWVDPDMCDYNKKYVYDVSINGNPTLEKYQHDIEENEYMQYEDEYEEEYENNVDEYDYEEYEYDD